MNKKDKYYWSAQYAPALLTSFPLLLALDYLITSKLLVWQTTELVHVVLRGGTALLTGGIAFLLIQVNAYISKSLFQANAEDLPTTHLLLFSNNVLSKRNKAELHKKIFRDFNVKLLTAQEEQDDPKEAKKLIASIVARVRSGLQTNPFVRRRNIAYGFTRNFTGGCVLAAIIAGVLSVTFYFLQDTRLSTAIAFLCLYTTIGLLSRFIIYKVGKEYAETLFEQYLVPVKNNANKAQEKNIS